ncbi:MAG: proton-conducting transporter membrane subunit [Bacteroidota bacterium]|nr:proton-conducting transporter membrane subunit [Bacteroidota bacterium]
MLLYYFLGTVILSGLIFYIRRKAFTYSFAVIFVFLQLGLTAYGIINYRQTDLSFFSIDPLAILFLIILSILTIPTFIHSFIYINNNLKLNIDKNSAIYLSSIVIFITSMTGVYLANHLVVIWVFLELSTISASVSVYLKRNAEALEASWKYVFVSSISIAFVFIGILFLSISMQEANITDLSVKTLKEHAPELNTQWLKIAFVFIFTGLTAKMGLFPMYTAGIDAKDKAPSPVSALLSTALLNAGFVAFIRFYSIFSATSIKVWMNYIMILSGLLSVFVATVYMMKVKNYKRMYAYSSIEHAGLVIMAIAAGGIGIFAAIWHLVLHSFAKSALFYQTGQVFRAFHSKSISHHGNYFRINFAGAMVLVIGFLCITAIPPSGMFITEFFILKSFFEANMTWLIIVTLILLTFIIYSFSVSVFRLLYGDNKNITDFEKINPLESATQYVFLGIVIWLGFFPPQILLDLMKNVL